jgi:transcriptional regulator with XRE-family HTH domain
MYGSYIRAARERAGLSPAEAARRVGYDSPDMIYKIEKDKANASLEMLDRMADAYNVRIGDLLPNSGGSLVEDQFQPLMAAMFGLSPEDADDLILRLSEIARQMSGWRRREAARVERSSDVHHDLNRSGEYPTGPERRKLPTSDEAKLPHHLLTDDDPEPLPIDDVNLRRQQYPPPPRPGRKQ